MSRQFVLVTTMWSTFMAVHACITEEWFGPVCVNKCRCRPNDSCQQSDGSCFTRGSCQDGYTGTACQYVDVAFRGDTSGENLFVEEGDISDAVDGRRDTCFTSRADVSVTWSVRLKRASWVTQVNVVVQEKSLHPEKVTVSICNRTDPNDSRSQLRLAGREGRELTYLLPHPHLASRVCISAADVPLGLCEVHVLGGRNLALKKQAQKFPTDSDKKSSADNAVDDEDNESNPDGPLTCAEARIDNNTDNQSDRQTEWQVDLGANLSIWRIEINGKIRRSIRNAGFRISLLLHNGSKATVFETDAHELEKQTVITLGNISPATGVSVSHSSGRTLSLCDVRIFGDCIDGYYGWLCDHRCDCNNKTEVCDKVLGTCSRTGCRTGWQGPGCREPCTAGYYGDRCESQCKRCIDNNCHHVNGSCKNLCHDGWTGNRCDQECPDGSYGFMCKARCRCHDPDEACDKVNGSCLVSRCASGWQGTDCKNECPDRNYGFACKAPCSCHDPDEVCDKVNGSCLVSGCASGWQGTGCKEECANGTYGWSCARNCSTGCVDGECHHVNGTCSKGCAVGWEGDDCRSVKCPPGTYGLQCRNKCSTRCADAVCHHVNGTCSQGCARGWTGHNCEIAESAADNAGIVVTCFNIGFMLSIAAYVIAKRRRCCEENFSESGR